MKLGNNAFLTGKDSAERKKFVVNLWNIKCVQNPDVEKDIQKTVDTLIKASD